MLAVGRALMADPKILLLDEPSLGLAPKVTEEILSTLALLNKEGLPIILGKDQQIAMGISTLVRFGVQIATDIGNGGERNLRVLNKTLTQRNGKRVLQLDVENSGENLLVPAISVELFDHKGASIGRFEGGRPRIYPTCSIRSIVDLNDVPAGKYAAMVLLDNGDEHVMGAQYELDLSP